MREFIPFDDRWFDEEPPGALVPLPREFTCVRAADGAVHWIPEDRSEKLMVSPLCTPSLAAVPALSSST